jgi:hypothetical protein
VHRVGDPPGHGPDQRRGQRRRRAAGDRRARAAATAAAAGAAADRDHVEYRVADVGDH